MEQPKQYVSYFVTIPEEKPVVSEYASSILLRETVKKQRIFDIARWEYTRHLMTEEDIHINGKRIAMTERERERDDRCAEKRVVLHESRCYPSV